MYPVDKALSDYVEKKKHGDDLLPFVVYGIMMPTLFSTYPLHCHEEIEMVLCDCGRCTYTVSGEDVTLEIGDILVMMPWVLHSFRLTDDKDYFLGAAYIFSVEMVSNYNVDICSSKYFSPLIGRRCSDYFILHYGDEHYSEFKEIALDMFNTFFERPDFFELKLKGLSGKLLFLMLNYGLIELKSETPEGNDVHIVRRVVDYISVNYMENITLARLAELANLSETGLSRLFRNITGMSCIDYVIEYRMLKAMGMLRTTDKPITEIAYETGFNNISYFNRTFKKHCNKTPSEFRRYQ